MNKRVWRAILGAAVVVGAAFVLAGCQFLFSAQYNENGISHFLNITIDESQPKEYVGELEDRSVYIEGLSIQETYFISVSDERFSVKDAIENDLVSIDEWRRYARNARTEDGIEILAFENYVIVVSSDECIIRSVSNEPSL